MGSKEFDHQGFERRIDNKVNNAVSSLNNSIRGTRLFHAIWMRSGFYHPVDDELLTYGFVKNAEVDFDQELGKIEKRLSNRNIDTAGKARVARMVAVSAARALIEKSENAGNIGQNFLLTARRAIHWGARRTEEYLGIVLDHDWINLFSMNILNGGRLREDLETYVSNPPVEQLTGDRV